MGKSIFDPAVQNQSAQSKIVVALERISEAFRVLLWNEGKSNGLSPIQVQILIFLRFHVAEKRKVSYLAQEFNMTKATISDSVKSLEQKGLISKEYELHDTRSYIIHLTKKGKQLAESTSMFASEIQNPIDKLSESDKENLLLSLIGTIQHLNQIGVITHQRMCFTCRYYSKKNSGHYCNLLQSNLANNDLRIDCPEHQIRQ